MSGSQAKPVSAAATARKLFDRLLQNAGVLVDDVVASEAFSATMSRGLGAVAGATSLVRNTTQQVGEFAADWLNVPTRHQLIEMAARLNRVEVMLDDIDFRTGELLERSEPEADDD